MPNYYPIFVNLESGICLVVGAGPVGARKAAGLLEAGAVVRLVAPVFSEAAIALSNHDRVQTLKEPYRTEHLNLVSLAFAATNNAALNAEIVADAGKRNIPVNCANSPNQGDFIIPAVLRRGDLCIAVSTGGSSPKLAQRIRSELEIVYSAEYAAYLELLTEMRSYIKERTSDSELRSAAFESLVNRRAEAMLRDLLRVDRRPEAIVEARRIVEAAIIGPLE